MAFAGWRGFWPCALLVAPAFVGCGSNDGPEPVPVYRHDYSEEMTTTVEPDTVLLTVGTSYFPSGAGTTRVYVDTAPSEDELLRLELRIIGSTYDPDERAVVDHRWRGDTLQVWCAYGEPRSWKTTDDFDKTSYPEPWFMPKRVDIRLPAGTGARYIGNREGP